jgi:hypothetical protein
MPRLAQYRHPRRVIALPAKAHGRLDDFRALAERGRRRADIEAERQGRC